MRAQSNEGVECHEKHTKIPYSRSSSGGHAALLLAGCQQGNHGKDKVPAVEQTQATVDTTEEDTMAAYYERMQRLKVLIGGTRWESKK